MEDCMLSKKSVDGLLIGALFHCRAVRIEYAHALIARLALWKKGVAIFGMIIVFALSSFMRDRPQTEMELLVLCALSMPFMFGWFVGAVIMHHARMFDDDESGMVAARICRSIESISSEKAAYIPTFIRLLEAILDENTDNTRHIIDCAIALEAYGPESRMLTRIVYETFE